jgi:hypothetical protein
LNKIGKSSNKGNLSNFFFDFLVFTYFLWPKIPNYKKKLVLHIKIWSNFIFKLKNEHYNQISCHYFLNVKVWGRVKLIGLNHTMTTYYLLM